MYFNWQVFSELSSFLVQCHWMTAVIGFFLGGALLLRPVKGDGLHRLLGATYAVVMVVTCISAFFVRHGEVSGLDYLSLKGMSWIHIFIPLTLYGLIAGLDAILRRKNKARHKWPLIASYVGGLIIAGSLTLMPGRRMHLMFFESPERVEKIIGRQETPVSRRSPESVEVDQTNPGPTDLKQ